MDAIERHLDGCLSCRAALSDARENGGPALVEPDTSIRGRSELQVLSEPRRVHEPRFTLTPPFALGRYHVEARIGNGGMGTVFRAVHTRLRKPVAIKILAPFQITHPRAVARFEREIEAVGRLDHPHIVRATDAGEADGLHFLVMDLIDGFDLSRLVRLCGPLPPAEACELARAAALGLQCAHEAGLVHRDIKPSNLILSAQGVLKILDLGLALLSLPEQADELTASGQVMGTANYMAPEQWQSSHDVDIRADLYSLGCTLYFLLGGRPPFDGFDQKRTAHQSARVPPLASFRSDLPGELSAILERLLAKDPDDRYATPAEVAWALEPLCRRADLPALVRRAVATERGGISAAGPASPGYTPVPREPSTVDVHGRRKKARFVRRTAVAVVAVAALLSLGLFWLQGRSDPEPQRPVFKAGERYELLNWPPTQFWWYSPTRESRYSWDRQTKRLHVYTHSLALLSLGTNRHPRFSLHLGLRQPAWTGDIGVFFGGTRDPQTGHLSCQYIELYRRNSRPVEYRLERRHVRIEPLPLGEPAFTDGGLGGCKLAEEPAPREYTLQIQVAPGRLADVRWDGAPCPGLIDQNLQVAAPPQDFQGEFGLLCRRGSVQLNFASYSPWD
jgi:serine/threonine protein kinase